MRGLLPDCYKVATLLLRLIFLYLVIGAMTARQ